MEQWMEKAAKVLGGVLLIVTFVLAIVAISALTVSLLYDIVQHWMAA